jgi:serine/threonine protein kinase
VVRTRLLGLPPSPHPLIPSPAPLQNPLPQGDLGLNIREAHVFNTTDGFALDVFVVDGWNSDIGESLEEQLGQRLLRMPPPVLPTRGRATSTSGPNIDPAAGGGGQQQQQQQSPTPASGSGWSGLPPEPPPAGFQGGGDGGGAIGPGAWVNRAPGSSSAPDDWEIDISQLHIDSKVAAGARYLFCGWSQGRGRTRSPAAAQQQQDCDSARCPPAHPRPLLPSPSTSLPNKGSFSNLYKGFYCGQEVAVKILKDLQDDAAQYNEFLQEVSIMRKVRHKNVVQFIGACTRKPNLCIVFEYMSNGSVYDWVRREGLLKPTQVLKVAVEVSRGMDYLHQRKIIHRWVGSGRVDGGGGQ